MYMGSCHFPFDLLKSSAKKADQLFKEAKLYVSVYTQSLYIYI